MAAVAVAGILAFPLLADVTMSKIGEYPFGVDGCGGIAYAGGSQFYVLRDHNASNRSDLYPLALDIDPSTGVLVSQSLGSPVEPGSLRDAEGIAFDPGSGTLWISDERETSIREFYPNGFQTGRSVPVPLHMVLHRRPNLSLEALTVSGDGLTMWTANEEALTCDGKTSAGNAMVQTVVRLTRFDRKGVQSPWRLSGQWAYACDPCSGGIFSQSGLSGLCALPDGSLLVLEREVSTATSGRCRIYRITPWALAMATDIASLASLSNTCVPYSAVRKGAALLDFNNCAESSPLDYNMIVYEGICLGPRLADGAWSVFLVSDGGTTKSYHLVYMTAKARTVSRLCALKLSGLETGTED